MNEQNSIHDVLITGGTVVGTDGEHELDVAIEGDRIAGLHERGTAGEARRVIDATGCLVIPGGIDPHVHYELDFQGILTTEGPEYTEAAHPAHELVTAANARHVDVEFVRAGAWLSWRPQGCDQSPAMCD